MLCDNRLMFFVHDQNLKNIVLRHISAVSKVEKVLTTRDDKLYICTIESNLQVLTAKVKGLPFFEKAYIHSAHSIC